jgi:hypothetical protein
MSTSRFKTIESDPNDLIPLSEAAKRIGVDPSTIRKRKAGTHSLTLVRQGRGLYVLRGEILAYRQRLIDDARRRNNLPKTLAG